MDLGLPQLVLGRLDDVRWAIDRVTEREDEIFLGWTEYRPALLTGLLAAVEGRIDDALERFAEAVRRIERLPVRLVDRDVLNGFAVLAHHTGDHQRAAALAVASNGPAYGRSPGVYVLHIHYRRLVRLHVSADVVAALRGEAARTTVEQAIAAELERWGRA